MKYERLSRAPIFCWCLIFWWNPQMHAQYWKNTSYDTFPQYRTISERCVACCGCRCELIVACDAACLLSAGDWLVARIVHCSRIPLTYVHNTKAHLCLYWVQVKISDMFGKYHLSQVFCIIKRNRAVCPNGSGLLIDHAVSGLMLVLSVTNYRWTCLIKPGVSNGIFVALGIHRVDRVT